MATYEVHYYCTNCGNRESKNIEKGREADSRVRCSHCECFTLERTSSVPNVNIHPKRNRHDDCCFGPRLC